MVINQQNEQKIVLFIWRFILKRLQRNTSFFKMQNENMKFQWSTSSVYLIEEQIYLMSVGSASAESL